nr:alpha-amylase [candidate division Zixibacteria bacterium]NIX57387.1 alpha-amylase [candidate division Zixibacteria bacterium]
IHPIGKEKRKGELGSYYSIQDYKAVNPNFGTMQDFKDLVEATHEHDMKLFLDWVPNHTAWDHPWTEEHPEYYMKDSTGAITYEADWTDIAQLNYENKELWDKMIDRMKFWIDETNIDGYRVDHAGHDIPLDFWKNSRGQ